ncbi:MAG: nucleoside 2-deoxyribosyltransferase domain-containing protein [Acidobacteriota bacterium]
MVRVLKPPMSLDAVGDQPSVFLAGSIEMGRAEDWQERVTTALADEDVVILNPRRDEWDASWEQSIDNPRFREQVEWELDGQDRANVIAMYFAPDTRAPITLMELGLFARSGKVIACCPDGYWRKGNIEVVCARHDIPLVEGLEALVEAVRTKLARESR